MKIILDLCGGTGSWSKPYKDAGYDVRVITKPGNDVATYHPPEGVYGVLAAPPCTMFSMARTNAKLPRDLKGAMETVQHCLRIIWECQYNGNRLAFWALENPKARLRWFMGIPAMTFDPTDYGDPHHKATDLWGNFSTELMTSPISIPEGKRKQSHLSSEELPPLPDGYVLPKDFDKRAAQRSITPQGFAKAFFEANR